MSRADEIRKERAERGYDPTAGRMRQSVNEAALDRKSWHYRFVNDEGDRVFQVKEMGYEIDTSRQGAVKKDGNAGMGSETAVYAGKTENGAAMKSVLMRIPKEIYDEDQAAKKRRIDETEVGIARGKVAEASPEDQAAFYGGMKINAER